MLTGVQAAAAKTSYPAPRSARYSYTNALHKTLLFTETMRSGKLPRYRVAWCAALFWPDPLNVSAAAAVAPYTLYHIPPSLS